MHYTPRPPYLTQVPQGVAGMTADRINAVFREAGIGLVWINTPFLRQLRLIEEGNGCDCLAGVFRTPARESYARYTLPLYQDQPFHALIRAEDERIKPGASVLETFKRADLILEIKKGYSYGRWVDAQITALKPRFDVTTSESEQMLKKLAAGRVDYILMAPHEAEGLIAAAGMHPGRFRIVPFADMPPGENRYIMCSRKVEQSLIQRLDATIRKKSSSPRPR
ncbi:extracellular solute-binding protein, family 3 [Formivibrio citricus]|uniref:Extracellular solute-binding protein, family 3 n=2 Tax=Formivibrio citricus TaxID=83765 RepID=A0A1I4VQH3_9NEIS|nr:extracellular solute-binding protein, family 3 [Formivibrio citricus]